MKKLFPLITVMTIFMGVLLVSTQTAYAASLMLNTPSIEGKKPTKTQTRPVLVIGDLSIMITGNLNYANATPKAASGAATTLTLTGTYQFKSKDNKPISKTVRLNVTGLKISIANTTIPSNLTWTGKGTYSLNKGIIQIHCSATSGNTKYNLILHGRVAQPIISLPSGGQGTVKFTSPQSKLVITPTNGSATTYFLTLTDSGNTITLTPRSV
ncbi:hypothetical protein KEJ26_03525 [Candidatus Bathyarchaeota archaeon]|nr:hypothetical protein [Candidatus Bathyarchaeota archaeon]